MQADARILLRKRCERDTASGLHRLDSRSVEGIPFGEARHLVGVRSPCPARVRGGYAVYKEPSTGDGRRHDVDACERCWIEAGSARVRGIAYVGRVRVALPCSAARSTPS